jgi:cysteine desulfurase
VENPFHQLKTEGFEITQIPVDTNGILHVEDVEKAIRPDTILISVMYVNNEIGTIQPISAIAELAEKHNIIFHTDAVQAFGKIRINLAQCPIHLLSASAHKLYGPKGVGILFIRNQGNHPKIGKFIDPIIYGGGHEFGYRSSTENIPGIIGFAKAVEIADATLEKEQEREQQMRDDFIQWVLKNIPDSWLNGHSSLRIAGNINLGFKYIEGESLLLYLDQEDIEVSTGSACSSKSLKQSHVLSALGLAKTETHGSIRITLGRQTTKVQLDFVKEKLFENINKLRKISPLGH